MTDSEGTTDSLPQRRLLTAAAFEHFDGSTWVTDESETYTYTDQSYLRSDLTGSTYTTAETLYLSYHSGLLPPIGLQNHLLQCNHSPRPDWKPVVSV